MVDALQITERVDSPLFIPTSPSVPVAPEVSSKPDVAKSEPKVASKATPTGKTAAADATTKLQKDKSSMHPGLSNKDSTSNRSPEPDSNRPRNSSIPDRLDELYELMHRLKVVII